ncbi:MAG: hypothetical protein WCU74_04060 [Candidatus Omnitrophota bacterium]
MNRRFSFCLVVVIALAAYPCLGEALPEAPKPVARTIVVLYDSSDPRPLYSVQKFAENLTGLYLNYLGMKARYFDINGGFPDDALMADPDVRGILTLFIDEEMVRPVEYCRWLEQQVKNGKKLVILGNMGALTDKRTKAQTPLEEVNRVFGILGLEYRGNWTDNPFVIRIASKDASMVEFERTLEDGAGEYDGVRSLNADNRVYLTLERTDLADSASAAVVTTSRGGYAQEAYAFFIEYLRNRVQWRIHPFRFYEEAFGLKDLPRFDTTTAFGKRILYSHIDGDGIRNASKNDSLRYAGEIIYEKILKKYPVPITVSFISSDILTRYFGSRKLETLVRDIAALPNVEVGVHAFTHPLDWSGMITAVAVKGYSKLLKDMPNDLASESAYGAGARVTVGWEEYLEREVAGAVEDLNSLLPEGKKAVIYQWTGNCLPPQEALKRVHDLGLKNINGGDSRFDDANPSYVNVSSFGRAVGPWEQYYSSNANENIYTNLWTGPFGAYEKVIETFRETEEASLADGAARRVSPMNIYYHFYSGERPESIRALGKVYDYALGQDPIPLFTSEYVARAEAFSKASVSETPGGWIFKGFGDLRTVRLDSERRYPDLKRSEGVIGFHTWRGHLYVHLNNVPQAVLVLSDAAPAETPYLESASAPVDDWKVEGGRILFRTRVVGGAGYEIRNLQAGKEYRVTVTGADGKGGVPRFRGVFRPDGAFRLDVTGHGKFDIVVEP